MQKDKPSIALLIEGVVTVLGIVCYIIASILEDGGLILFIGVVASLSGVLALLCTALTRKFSMAVQVGIAILGTIIVIIGGVILKQQANEPVIFSPGLVVYLGIGMLVSAGLVAVEKLREAGSTK